MRDVFIEIWESVRRNKLRTCLTGFAVAWGIFMLIVLLGSGNGLLNSFRQGSDDIAVNTMQLGGGWTSKPYGGLKSGRSIELDERDIAITKSELFSDHVDDVVATVGKRLTVSYGQRNFSGYLEGNYPERLEMEKIDILYGRFINRNDIEQSRKVVVLPEDKAGDLLDGTAPVASIIGQKVKIGGFLFTVVGIKETDKMSSSNIIYAPFTTVRTIFSKGKTIDDLTFTFHGLKTEEENEQFEKDYKAAINLSHGAAPDDDRATWIWNRFTQNMQMEKGGDIINIGLWVIGIFTLLSGIVGVSNIMLITVKERTHEFGIRKAIGARPWSIMKLIIAESVTITAVFGYVGMVLGLLACELLDKTLGQSTASVLGMDVAMLVNPTVGVDVALEATLLLVVAGTLAGLVPARKAARVRPIEALRAE